MGGPRVKGVISPPNELSPPVSAVSARKQAMRDLADRWAAHEIPISIEIVLITNKIIAISASWCRKALECLISVAGPDAFSPN